jgi:hypothetical protein
MMSHTKKVMLLALAALAGAQAGAQSGPPQSQAIPGRPTAQSAPELPMLQMPAVPASAQKQQPQPEARLPAPTMSFKDARFIELDTNRDGRIDPEEFLAEKKRAWNKYSNGATMGINDCAQSSLDSMANAGASGAKPEWIRGVQRSCARLDKKNDGALSWEEFAGPTWSFFKLLDVNHDGFLSPQELADQGLSALRSVPKPPPMTERQQQIVAQDLQRVKTQHRVPRTLAQAQAEAEASASKSGNPSARLTPSANAAAPAQPGLAAQPVKSPEQQRSEGVADRIMNWLR